MNGALLLKHYEQIADVPEAIPRLRRFVLDLAVRGKLVDQDSADEPASEFLNRIAAEEARRKKGGDKIELGEARKFTVPVGWELVPLGNVVARHVGGGTPSKTNSAYWDGEIRWASVKDVGKSKFLDDTIDRITPEGLANSSSNLVDAGNLIVVTRMGLGKVSINRTEVAINQDLRALKFYSGVNVEYAYSFFLTHAFEGTGLTVKGIKVAELLAFPFPLPPLAEQNRIVAKVDELMELCDRLQAARESREAERDKLTEASLARLNSPDPETFSDDARFTLANLTSLTTRTDQTKKLRQTILNLAVRGKLVEQDPNDEPADVAVERLKTAREAMIQRKEVKKTRAAPDVSVSEMAFSLPPGWCWERFHTVMDVRDGTHDSPPDYHEADGYPLVTSKDFKNGEIDFSSARRISPADHAAISIRSRVTRNDILFSMIGGNIGNQVIVQTDRQFSIKNVALFKFYDPTDFIPRYAKILTEHLAQNLQSNASGGAQPFVSLGYLRNLAVAVPPVAEQHRIVGMVDQLMALCDQLEANLTEGEQFRSRLLESVLHHALEPA